MADIQIQVSSISSKYFISLKQIITRFLLLVDFFEIFLIISSITDITEEN